MTSKDLPPPYSANPYPYAWNETTQSGLNFIDFLPAVITRAECCTLPTYEPFRTLVERANQWLQGNRQWKLFTCESIEFACRGYYADSNEMTFTEYHEHSNFYVRGIRLFLRERSDVNEMVQQIGYLNLCPQKIESGGFFSLGKFEPLDVVVQKFNTYMRSTTNPAFQGRIITIETQHMKKSCNFDPDLSNWVERRNEHFVYILRIFYEVSPAEPEEIGIQDFVPFQLSRGGILTLPEYEPFSNVIRRASLWCSEQQDIRICNVQSVEIKTKRDGDVNPQKTDYTESGVGLTGFARILRVAYTKSVANSSGVLSALTCKTFIPVQLSRGCVPTYENLYQTKERVCAWVKATGARVVSAETSKFRLLNRHGRMQIPEDSFAVNAVDRNEHWIYVICLYLNGVYQEPPPETLPPMPYVTGASCALL